MPTIVERVIDNTIKSAIEKGGPGSGNFGHTGRPGHRGGSAGGGGVRKFDYESGNAYLYDAEGINPKVSGAQREALELYKDELSDSLNRTMRGAEGYYEEEYDEEEKAEFIDHIAGAIDKGVLPDTITTYRGISGKVFGEGDRTGDTFTDKAFVSTTLDRDIASGMFAEGIADGIVLEIRVPKGTKALNMEAHGMADSSEVELLLQRDSTFKIVADNRSTGKGMVLKVIPTSKSSVSPLVSPSKKLPRKVQATTEANEGTTAAAGGFWETAQGKALAAKLRGGK